MKHLLTSLLSLILLFGGLVSCSDDSGENNQDMYFTVSFDSQGGSEVESQKIKSGELAVKPENPTKDGVVFTGWFTSTKFDREWNFVEDVVNKDVTLYAKWLEEDEVCLVSFETNGGSKAEQVRVEKGGVLSFLPTPEKEGFLFEGWYEDAALSRKFDITTKINSNLTLYAKWKPESEGTLKKLLEELVKKAEGLQSADYSEDSYSVMLDALKVAKEVVSGADATQDEMQKAYDGLKKAIDNLFPNGKDLFGKPYKIIIERCPLWEDKYVVINSGWNSTLYLPFYALSISGEQLDDYIDFEFTYDREKLKKWAVDGNIGGTARGLRLTLKPGLTVGEEVEITVTARTNPEVSTKVVLKIYDGEWIKKTMLETAAKLPDYRTVTLDNYFEAVDIFNSIESLDYAGILPSDYDNPEMAAIKQKIDEYNEELLDYMWDSPLVHVKDDVYIMEYELFRYTSNGGKFPAGEFRSEMIKPEEDGYYQDILEFRSDKDLFWYYREIEDGKDENTLDAELEYKYIPGEEDGTGTVIYHILKEYYKLENLSTMSAKRLKHSRNR